MSKQLFFQENKGELWLLSKISENNDLSQLKTE